MGMQEYTDGLLKGIEESNQETNNFANALQDGQKILGGEEHKDPN